MANEGLLSDPAIGVKHLSWSNFRSFRRADIDLARITVLLGRNNSGKSSIHRPLLLMKQTLDIESSLPGLYARGPLVDCGAFKDSSFLGKPSPITFRLEFDSPLTLQRQVDGANLNVQRLEFSFREGDRLNPFELIRYWVGDDKGTRLLERTLQDSHYDYHGSICKGNPPSAAFDKALRVAIANDLPQHFLFRGSHLLMRAITTLDVDETRPESFYISQFALKYMALTDAISDWMTSYLSRLTYIGPVRALPQRTYSLGAIYERREPTGVDVPEIVFRILRGETGLYSGSSAQFQTRLSRYMRRLGLDGTLVAPDRGDDAFSLYVEEPSGATVNLADSAFGFSQVLPLVVRVLLTRPGETLIVEQPEIHLNPAVQSALADVFVEGISQGSNTIIETHSDHLLNRLRVLVAKGTLPVDDLAVYFVERGPKQSRVRRINVMPTGALDDTWPAGFFGDALRQARELNVAQRELWKAGKE